MLICKTCSSFYQEDHEHECETWQPTRRHFFMGLGAALVGVAATRLIIPTPKPIAAMPTQPVRESPLQSIFEMLGQGRGQLFGVQREFYNDFNRPHDAIRVGQNVWAESDRNFARRSLDNNTALRSVEHEFSSGRKYWI